MSITSAPMRTALESLSGCQLDYAILTDPHPLRTDKPATLDIIVVNNTNRVVYCKQISVGISLGPNAQDLAKNTEALHDLDVIPVTPDPSLHAELDRYDWTAVLIQDDVVTFLPQQEYHSFGTTTGSSDTNGDTQAIILRIAGLTITDQPGQAAIEITETATSTTEWPDSPASTRRYLPKHTIPDHCEQATLWALNKKKKLATRVEPGTPLVLQWNGPHGVPYQLWRNGLPLPGDIKEAQYRVEEGITRDTTFTLVNRDTTTPLATATITVTDPTFTDLTVTTLQASDATCTTTSLTTTSLNADTQIHITQTWKVTQSIKVDKHARLAR